MTLKIGDFVLIFDVDSDDQMDVAKICFMYEDKDSGPMDPCRALVKWYTKPEVLKKKYLKNETVDFHKSQEVIENDLFDSDISIETIVSTCNVKVLKINDEFLDKITSKTKRNFFCRYKLMRKPDSTRYMLQPMIQDPRQAFVQVNI